MWADFLLRSALSGLIATALYIVFATTMARFHGRKVVRNIWSHDFKLGLISLGFGSPVLQGFALLAERYDVTFMYTELGAYGWAWWIASLPLYVLLWDAVFYLGHLVLHIPWVYRHCHFRHHMCRPPVPWSGVAIDPAETILSGILPYTIPLFILPFHIYTVYSLNILLLGWATLVHSTANWTGTWVMLGTKDHNLHHAYGLKNKNFGAVFTMWDRMGRSFDRVRVAPWWGKPAWSKTAGAVHEAARHGDAAPGLLSDS